MCPFLDLKYLSFVWYISTTVSLCLIVFNQNLKHQSHLFNNAHFMWCFGLFCSKMLIGVFNNCHSDSVPVKILLFSTLEATLDQQMLTCVWVAEYFWVWGTRNEILKSGVLDF